MMHGNARSVKPLDDEPPSALKLHDALDHFEAATRYRWPAGEHRGKFLADLPDTFLKWAEKNTWHDDVREMCRAVLKHRERTAQTRSLREKLSAGAIDELLHVVFQLHERIDQLEDRLVAAGVA